MKRVVLVLITLFLTLQAEIVHLQKGWNLVGSSVNVENMDEIKKRVSSLFLYDKKTKRWKIYIKNSKYTFAPINFIEAGSGFWIYSEKKQDITLDGDRAKSGEFEYVDGWQLLSPKKYDFDFKKDLNKSYIKIVWKYQDNKWLVYSQDQEINKKISNSIYKDQIIKEIKKGEGFWLLAKIKSKTDEYDFIPKEITDEIAVRFLNKTTFGSTPSLVKELKQKGIVKWLNEQLSYDYDEKSDSLTRESLKMAKYINPEAYSLDINEYLKEDSTISLPPIGSDIYMMRRYFLSNWYKDVFYSKKQLRLRVAYALSQIVIASNASDMFNEKYSALSAYYDLLKRYAFGKYGDLLKEVSKNPAMGYYLTFYGNKKKYKNDKGEWVYPDENYAREVMQLFSISPFLLNQDGTIKRDKKLNPLPSYTQKDVNEMARVFTGLDFRLTESFGNNGFRNGDMIHKMVCNESYHDSKEKTVLGKVIPSGGNCYEDIDRAVDILISHPNSAPFISKKLILRLAKSNPSADYIARVAKVFADNGKGVRGDLKAVIKAIYLDREFWSDIKNHKPMKYKEPLIAFTQLVRALNVKPIPKWKIKISPQTGNVHSKEKILEDSGFIYMADPKEYFSQGPTESPSVFNFYSDDYVPNGDYFIRNNLVAPELQIQTDGFFVKYHNYVWGIINQEKTYALNKNGLSLHGKSIVYKDLKEYGMDLDNLYYPNKIYLDFSKYYQLIINALKDEAKTEDLEEILKYKSDRQYTDKALTKAITDVVNLLDKDLLGNTMSNGLKTYLISKFSKDMRYHKNLREFGYADLGRMIDLIATSDDYMVE